MTDDSWHDHPNRGPHRECLVDHQGVNVPRHCTRGCPWPCQYHSMPSGPQYPFQVSLGRVSGLQHQLPLHQNSPSLPIHTPRGFIP